MAIKFVTYDKYRAHIHISYILLCMTKSLCRCSINVRNAWCATLSLANIWRVQHTVYSQFTIQSNYSGQWELSEISNVICRLSFSERNDVGEFDVSLNVHTCTSLESEWASERKGEKERDEPMWIHLQRLIEVYMCNVYVCVYVYVYVYVYDIYLCIY